MSEQKAFDSPAAESMETTAQEESAPLDASAILPTSTAVETTPNLTSEDPLNMAVNESSIGANELSGLEPGNTAEDAVGFETAPEIVEESAEEVVDMEKQPKIEEEKPTVMSKDVSEQRIRFLEARIAAAEHERHNANVEMANTANRNATYKRELESQKLATNERNAYIRSLEDENVRLNKELQFMEQGKDLANEKSEQYKANGERLSAQVQQLNDQLTSAKTIANEFRDKNLVLQSQLNTLKDHFQTVEFECDKYRAEVRLLNSSKEFYSQMESQVEDEKDTLRLKVFRLESEIAVALGTLELGRQQLAVEQKRCEQALAEKDTELDSLREQFQTLQNEHEMLVGVHEQVESTRKELESQLNESTAALSNEQKQVQLVQQRYKEKVTEFNNQLLLARTNLETAQAEAEQVVAAKDHELVESRAEIGKLNEKLQLYAKMSNAGDPEIMAPAAARTANMMKNANSLTEIYAEHFSLIAELESTKADLREAERTLIQLREILVEHAPLIQERQEQFDQAVREAEILREQLSRYERDREELVTSRDSYLNELRFTKNSLEEKQRECQTLSKQVQNLLARTRATGASQDQPMEEGSELFSNIPELQQRNLELTSRIKTMEVEKDEAIRNAQDDQFNELKHQLEVATQNLETVELRNKHLATCKNEAEKQRDYYKKAFDELQKRADDALDSPQVKQLRRDKEGAESRAKLAEERLVGLKEELKRTENQANAKDEVWKQINEEAKSMVAALNDNAQAKQSQINKLLTEKHKVEQLLREVELRHRVQASHTSFLEKGNHKLLEKQTKMNEELRTLQTAKLELDKELQQWKQTAQMTQLELDIIRQRFKADFNLNSTLNELSSILDRKKLLIESMQNSVVVKLTAERDEWRLKYEKELDEKSQMERDLKADMLRFKNETTRLEVEWEAAQKVAAPLQAENNELRAQCRELTDDLIASQKQISENQLNSLSAKVALNESIMLRKQLEEALETADYWQTRCEQTILERASESVGEGQEQCSNPNHSILMYYVTECRERMDESRQRVMALHGQISTLEVKNRQLEDDMQFADSTTTSQMERLTQMEAEYKQVVDKFSEIGHELKRVKNENEQLTANVSGATSKQAAFETEAQALRDALQTEEANKLALQTLLEEKEETLSARMDEFRQYKANFEVDHQRISNELAGAQQREQELTARLAEARQEFNQLVANNSGDASFEALKRAFDQLRGERNAETSLRFQLTTELNSLRQQNQEEKQRVSSLLSDLDAANHEIKTKNDQLEDQREKMDSYNTLQGKIDALVAERTELQKKMVDLETERENLFEQMQMESAQRDSQTETLDKQIDSLETSLKESIERENKLKETVKGKDDFIAKLRALANNFKSENEKLKAAQKPQEEKLAEMNKLHETQAAQSKQQIEKLTVDLKAKQTELQEVQIKLSSTQEALSNAASQSAAPMRSTAASRMAAPIRAALGGNINVPPGRANVAKELQNKSRQVLELSALNQELEGKLTNTEQRLKQRETELQSEINRLNDQIIDLMQENGENQKKIMESERVVNEYTANLKAKDDEIDQLTMRNQMIGGTLETTRKRFEDFKTLHAHCEITQQVVTA